MDDSRIERYDGRPQGDGVVRSAAETGVYDFLDCLGVDYVTYCHGRLSLWRNARRFGRQ